MKSHECLIFVPTYNERENIGRLFAELNRLEIPHDLLLLDDNSPDGTGQIIDDICTKHPNVYAIHRKGKEGIGSAHRVGINWAYDKGYTFLITMDGDFTHSPNDIENLWRLRNDADVVVASRHLNPQSLEGWNLTRKFLTRLGHVLTRAFLGIQHDATGAFRLYRLDRIPKTFLDYVESNGYSFFFESLYVLCRGGLRIREIPICLPPRTYGSSKMDYTEVGKSLARLARLFAKQVRGQANWRADGTCG